MTKRASKIDYAKIDANIRDLVRALDSMSGVRTIGSCGGHADAKEKGGGRWDEGTFYVNFRVERSSRGWRALEALAYLVNNYVRRAAGKDIIMYPYAALDYAENPAGRLRFSLEGRSIDLKELAKWVKGFRWGQFMY